MTYYDTSYPPSLWAPPPDPIEPTGITVGAPGSFTPTGAEVPASIAELNALAPLGQTDGWDPGEYVVIGSGNAYWNGTAFFAGITPEPSPPPEEPESVPDDEEPVS